MVKISFFKIFLAGITMMGVNHHVFSPNCTLNFNETVFQIFTFISFSSTVKITQVNVEYLPVNHKAYIPRLFLTATNIGQFFTTY